MPRKTPDLDLTNLCEAIYHARKDLEVFRVERKTAVKQYVGGHWSMEGAPGKVPLNLISLYTNIVGRSLVPKEPRVLMSTFNQSAKPTVSAMQAWANLEIQRMGLDATLQRVVIDSLYSIGICKVALVDPAHSSLWGWNTPAGTAFAERVDLDDFVFDTHARDFREAAFIGHRYRVPLASVKDDRMYSSVRKTLSASEDSSFNQEGDVRINTMQRGQSAAKKEYEEMVDLWEVYLPRHRMVVTLPHDAVLGSVGGEGGVKYTEASLREVEWVGPDNGPYHFLALGIVPGNAMPKSPIQDLIDLHTVTNELYTKLMRQGERQKEILAVQGQADADGKRIMDASDGDIVRLDNPDRTKVASFGGPNQSNLQLAIHLKDVFSYMAGNLDAMGGLSPQAKTLGQDKMLMESASRTVTDMQQTTINFVSGVCKALGWYWWHDPHKVMRVEHKVNGLSESAITRSVYPRGVRPPAGQTGMSREADWDDLNLSVDPYSLQHATPSSKLQSLMQVVQQVILPMQGLLQQAGVAFDVVKLLKIMGEYMNLPELQDIVTVQEPPQPTGGPEEPDAPGMPANTTRTYERRSLGGNTADTRQKELANMTSPAGGGGGGTVQ